MKEHNIMTSQVHNRNDLNTCVAEYNCNLPNITALEQTLICIPVGWWLEKEQLDYIVDSIKGFW